MELDDSLWQWEQVFSVNRYWLSCQLWAWCSYSEFIRLCPHSILINIHIHLMEVSWLCKHDTVYYSSAFYYREECKAPWSLSYHNKPGSHIFWINYKLLCKRSKRLFKVYLRLPLDECQYCKKSLKRGNFIKTGPKQVRCLFARSWTTVYSWVLSHNNWANTSFKP